MKNALFTSLVALGIASSSFAFDGSYVGANIGYDAQKTNAVEKDDESKLKNNFNYRGFSGNLVAGYGQVLANKMYIGGEFNAGLSTANKKKTKDGDKTKLRTPYQFGAAARLGYVFNDDVLVYAKAGLNTQHMNYESKNNATNDELKYNNNQLGIVTGLGADYKVASNLSVGAEYNYITYLQYKIESIFDGDKVTGTIDQNTHRILMGVKYYFN